MVFGGCVLKSNNINLVEDDRFIRVVIDGKMFVYEKNPCFRDIDDVDLTDDGDYHFVKKKFLRRLFR